MKDQTVKVSEVETVKVSAVETRTVEKYKNIETLVILNYHKTYFGQVNLATVSPSETKVKCKKCYAIHTDGHPKHIGPDKRFGQDGLCKTYCEDCKLCYFKEACWINWIKKGKT